ncbi:menaquinone biosynthesis protein [Flavobacteriales bacterium]|nr:menaquinone biosynthesis protein [Flavobacteriales bacterium]
MIKYKVSAVSYLNTTPFIYGIKNSDISNQIELLIDFPAECARKLLKYEVDIALVPISILKKNPEFNIISDFCIGSEGKVDTVCLYSELPLKEIEEIYLDYQSRTSVELLRILCREYWKISPKLRNSEKGFENKIQGRTAALIIGDRAFSANSKFKYIYDLSEIWKEMTGLPFVFACWISNKDIDKDFLSEFNSALKFGLSEIDKSVEVEKHNFPYCKNTNDYLNNKISYILDKDKREGMKMFLSKII